MRRAWPRARGAAFFPDGGRARKATSEGDVGGPREAHDGGESFGERESYDSVFHARPRFAPPSNALNTRTALTLYLLIVSVITARTVALTLIKVQLNKTKTENNHFCLTGKMARYVAEAVTTHAPLAKHMLFRPELCAGLIRSAAGGASNRSRLRIKREIRMDCE